MSIGLKIRGPCSMQWTLRVREISVGDGCDMHAVSSLVASQGRIYAVMWTRICGQTDRQQRVDGQEGEDGGQEREGEDSDQ